jgi:hypothetical protein
MTDERDPKVSQRYRELGAEEPPTELDAEILAASRRTAETRLAPLVPPTGRRRWYFPVAAAAIITLAVAVTLHMDRQQLDPEYSGLRSEPPEAKKELPAAAPPRESPAKPAAPREFARERAGAASHSPVADAMQERRSAESAPAPARLLGQVAKADSPEAALERIAELRRQGKHDEADKALAEFRRRYPDYRITEEMRKKVERP